MPHKAYIGSEDTVPSYCPGSHSEGLNYSYEWAYFSGWDSDTVRWVHQSTRVFDWEYVPGYNYCDRYVDKPLEADWRWYSHYSGWERKDRKYLGTDFIDDVNVDLYIVEVNSYTTKLDHAQINGINYLRPVHYQHIRGHYDCFTGNFHYNPDFSEFITYENQDDLVGYGLKSGSSYHLIPYEDLLNY